jgi:hypothetical protein
MTVVRGILQDLVEKKLWPLAVLLIAAIFAVPVLLGGDDAPAADPPLPAAQASADRLAKAAIELQGPANVRRPSGEGLDPFRQPPKPASSDAAPATGGAASTGGQSGASGDTGSASTGDSGSGSTGSTDTGGGASPQTPATPAPVTKKKPAGTFSDATVDLRFGETGAVKALRDVRRLSPLPSAEDPFFVFDGVLRGTRTARFTVSEDVRATGDGVCRPSKATCRSIDVRAGQSVYFDLKLADGTTKQFQLDVVSAGGAAASAAARSVYRTRVRFGSASSAPTHDLARLSAVGGVAAPALQYLGVGSDRRSAIFVLGPGATLRSRNACLDGEPCRIIALGRGDHATVSVRHRRYRVQVARIHRVVTSDRSAALRARRSAAVGGRALLRRMIADPTTATALGGLGFSAETGTVARH